MAILESFFERLVPVEGERERAAHPLVVEGLLLVVASPPMSTQSQGLSCTVILGPSACTRLSRSAGVKPRNWMWARSPRTAATWAEEELMKSAR